MQFRNRTRASDADRDAAVERLETGYVKGQLNGPERDSRVAEALSATTLGDLDRLTADLSSEAVQTPTALSADPKPVADRGRIVWGVVAVAIVAAVIVVVRQMGPAPYTPPRVGASPSATNTPSAAPWRVTAESLREFRDAFRTQFGTTDFYEMWVNKDHIYVEVPTRSASNHRSEGWTWRGTWFLMYPAEVRTDDRELTKLSDVAFGRLLAVAEKSRTTLGVEDAKFDGMYLDTPAGGPGRVSIRFANSFKEDASVETTLDGRVVSRSPYE